jgi:hypothetical protein
MRLEAAERKETMKIIDLNKGIARQMKVLSYGSLRSGKTRFAATWPRPLFLADATEMGWTTIANMDRSALYEPDRLPEVWEIEKATDMMQAIKDAEKRIQKKPGDIQTIVVDSLTFYADLYFNTLDALAQGRGDPRDLYLKLGQHLRDLRIRLHALPVNVVWLCLCKEPNDDNPMGAPMLSGQNSQKFAAGCDYVFYHRSHQEGGDSPVQWEVRTQRFGAYQAGGRDEGRLPSPLGYVDDGKRVVDCTYRALEAALWPNAKAATPIRLRTGPVAS